jgi:hypothetical protein
MDALNLTIHKNSNLPPLDQSGTSIGSFNLSAMNLWSVSKILINFSRSLGWTFLKEKINSDHIKDDLISTKLIHRDDCDGKEYHDKSRQRKIDHLLTCVVRNIGSPSDLEKFINIFETDHNVICHDTLFHHSRPCQSILYLLDHPLCDLD